MMALSVSTPAALHRAGAIFVLCTSMVGRLLLTECWGWPMHAIFTALLAVSLLLAYKGNAKPPRGSRIALRAITALVWVWLALMVFESLDAARFGFSGMHTAALQDGIVWFGGLFLCYITPVAVCQMLFFGVNTTPYDRLVGVLCPLMQLTVAGVALFTDAGVPWALGRWAAYSWLVLAAVSAVLALLCMRHRTPAQEKAHELRRARIEEKRAKRLGR